MLARASRLVRTSGAAARLMQQPTRAYYSKAGEVIHLPPMYYFAAGAATAAFYGYIIATAGKEAPLLDVLKSLNARIDEDGKFPTDSKVIAKRADLVKLYEHVIAAYELTLSDEAPAEINYARALYQYSLLQFALMPGADTKQLADIAMKLEQAATLQMSAGESAHDHHCETLNLLGLTYQRMGKPDVADAILRQALTINLEENDNRAMSYLHLATVEQGSDDLPQALKYIDKAKRILINLQAADASPTEYRHLLGRAADMESAILCMQGKGLAGLDAHKQAVAFKVGAYGDEHPSVAASELGFATGPCKQLIGPFRRAESCLRAHEIYTKTYGAEDPRAQKAHAIYTEAEEANQREISAYYALFGEMPR